LLGAAIFVDIPRRLLQFFFPLVLRYLRPLLIALLLPAVGLLLLVAHEVRQQFFLNEPMATACGEGDAERVRALLGSGASPDSWGIDFTSPAIVYAAEKGNLEIVKLLISKGADVNVRDSNGNSALEIAQRNRHAEIATLLIQAGAQTRGLHANAPK
jgi:hypothetical protein